jgi:hypothetical protein
MAFDSGDGQADRYFAQAISLSELAGDKAFSADVLVTLGNQLAHLGSTRGDQTAAAEYGHQVVELATAGLSATRRCGSPTSRPSSTFSARADTR